MNFIKEKEQKKKGSDTLSILCLDKKLFPESCFEMNDYTKNLKQTKIAKIKRWISVRLIELGIY